jgi:hypothetical protein
MVELERKIDSIHITCIHNTPDSTLQVAKGLVAGYSAGRQRKPKEADVGILDLSLAAMHEVTKFDGRPRVCMQCKRMGSKTSKGKTRETAYGCQQCKIHVHR